MGIFWFYWISFSFIHYGFSYLLPLGIIGVALVYAFMFLLSAIFFKDIFIRAGLLFLMSSFIHPFGFNWFDLRLLLLDSFFMPDFLRVFAFMMIVALCVKLKPKFKIFSLFLLIFCIDFNIRLKLPHLPFDYELANTNISQEDKWDKKLLSKHIKDNLAKIDQAIMNQKRVIILPESAFPLHLNMVPKLVTILKQKSKSIAIITGALTYENKKFYNSTYVFDSGKMQIFHKLFLVPFGEEIPLPSFLKNTINDIFYNGAQDFSVAKKVQDYTIDGVKIRNAICFEATKQTLYENNPRIMIALSNNAWFTPSTQPLMQKLLLRLHAKLNNTTIYHSVNGSKSYVVYP